MCRLCPKSIETFLLKSHAFVISDRGSNRSGRVYQNASKIENSSARAGVLATHKPFGLRPWKSFHDRSILKKMIVKPIVAIWTGLKMKLRQRRNVDIFRASARWSSAQG